MMPNERARRGGAVRGLIVGVVGIVLVLFAATTWGPFAASSATIAPSGSGAAVVPSGSPVPGGSVTPGSGAPSAPASVGPGSSSADPGSSSASSAPPSASAGPSASPASLGAKLQYALNTLRKKLQVPGVSAAILWDDGRSWVGAAGMRNAATKDPMTTGTAFAFASISKTFTAAVVLQLVDEGVLRLDQSVAPLLPAYKLDRRITVRMLLDHTSGLPDFFNGKGIDRALQKAPDATWTAKQAWAFVPKPFAPPAKYWMYSNTNYLLLGELVAAVTGQPLDVEIRQRLLDPLGLTTVYYQGVETPKEQGTVAYRLVWTTAKQWRAIPVVGSSSVMPFRAVITAAGGAGSLAGTAIDAATWMRAWVAGGVISPALHAQVLGDFANVAKLHPKAPYGLGMRRVKLNGYKAYGHSGRYLGVQNVAWRIPELGVTVVVLTNQSIWDPNRFASALLKVIAPVKPAPTPTPKPSPSPSG
jgi:D-alanyl-D-alanine carboxypeptidase